MEAWALWVAYKSFSHFEDSFIVHLCIFVYLLLLKSIVNLMRFWITMKTLFGWAGEVFADFFFLFLVDEMWYLYWIKVEKMSWTPQPIALCFPNADVLWPAASTTTTKLSNLWWNTFDFQSCVESSLSSNFKLWEVCSCQVFCYRMWKVT